MTLFVLFFYQSSVLVIEVIIGDMSKKKKARVLCVYVCGRSEVCGWGGVDVSGESMSALL